MQTDFAPISFICSTFRPKTAKRRGSASLMEMTPPPPPQHIDCSLAGDISLNALGRQPIQDLAGLFDVAAPPLDLAGIVEGDRRAVVGARLQLDPSGLPEIVDRPDDVGDLDPWGTSMMLGAVQRKAS